MNDISAVEALRIAREKLGLSPAIPARSFWVKRLDHGGDEYYLVVFGEENKEVALSTIRAKNGKIMETMRLSGPGPFPVPDRERALRHAGEGVSEIELVWRPCRISMSPFYPFWRVKINDSEFYVDHAGRVHSDMEFDSKG